MLAGPEAKKKVPASSTWWHFFEVQQLLALWFSSNSRMQKLNFYCTSLIDDEFEDEFEATWIVSVDLHVPKESLDAKILPTTSYLDAGRRFKNSGRPVNVI